MNWKSTQTTNAQENDERGERLNEPSNSVQSLGGAIVGAISNSAFGSSSLCSPIICKSLIHRDALMAALVNHMLRASAVAMSAHAWA